MCPSKQSGPYNFLLAEDTAMYRKLAVHMIEAVGHSVTTVLNGREAVKAAASRKFDVILMDVEMPLLNGLDATRLIRKSEPTTRHIPIIGVTTSDPDPCLQAGMDAHVRKPFLRSELFAAVARVMHQKVDVKSGLESKRILLVDDDPDIVQPLRRALQATGYSVLVASDGKEAMQVTERDEPDLIVLDLIMPYCNGLQVLEHLRQRGMADRPVIMITAAEDGRYRRLASRLGVDDYIQKPFGPDQLVVSVDRLLAA